MTAPYADLIERLLGIATTDHERLCQGREYSCSCGWDEENMEIGNQAAKAIQALQADNERLQAEVTRLLTAFDGLDLAAPPASVGREEIARMLRDMIYLQSIDTDHRVVGYEHAADAILAALAPTPPEGEG